MIHEREEQIITILADLLKRDRGALVVDAAWATQGVDSLTGLRLAGRLSELFGEDVDPMLLLDCSCIRELAERLARDIDSKPPPPPR